VLNAKSPSISIAVYVIMVFVDVFLTVVMWCCVVGIVLWVQNANGPLHLACINGHLNVVSFLVAKGAFIEAKNYVSACR
jgi:hypothetical protein